jgi:hypothetical protein
MTLLAKCPNCAADLVVGSNFCNKCGLPMKAPPRNAEHTYFANNRLTVTNNRLIIGNTTYTVANIAACNWQSGSAFTQTIGILGTIFWGGLTAILIGDPLSRGEPIELAIMYFLGPMILLSLFCCFVGRDSIFIVTNAGQSIRVLKAKRTIALPAYNAIQRAIAERS